MSLAFLFYSFIDGSNTGLFINSGPTAALLPLSRKQLRRPSHLVGARQIQITGYILHVMIIWLQAIEDLDGRTIINPTELRTNQHYIVYYNFVTKTLLTELFPYVSLIFFNVCIFREIRRSVEIQKAMRCTQSQKEEIKSANVVVSHNHSVWTWL